MMGRELAMDYGAEVILDLRDGRTNEAMENFWPAWQYQNFVPMSR